MYIILYLMAIHRAMHRLLMHIPVIPTRPEDREPSDAPNLLLGSYVKRYMFVQVCVCVCVCVCVLSNSGTL